MNRVEFMNQLEKLLQDIPAEERDEALQYYQDYFADAGIENEADLIKELESPEKVAGTIKAGLFGQNDNNSEYRETGYQDTRFEKNDHPATRTETEYKYEGASATKKRSWKGKIILLIIILSILASPIILPLGIGVLGLIVAILITIVAIVGVALFAGVFIAGSGILCLICAAMKLLISFPLALAMFGAGCLMLSLGAAMTVIVWWAVLKIVPPMFRRLVDFCSKKLRKTK